MWRVRVRQQRQAMGLRQDDLAARIGCDRSYIGRVESGAYPPPSATIMDRWLEVLGCLDQRDEMCRLADWDRYLRHVPETHKRLVPLLDAIGERLSHEPLDRGQWADIENYVRGQRCGGS